METFFRYSDGMCFKFILNFTVTGNCKA